MSEMSAGDGTEPTREGFRLDAVTVRFSAVTALDTVSLAIAAGERVGFVGPSGSGKTTLLRLFNATLRPSAGKVAVRGRQVTSIAGRELRALRGQIGFIHQDLSLVPNLRVIQNVLCGRLGRQSLGVSLRSLLFPKRSEAAAVHEILERVGIGEKLYERTDRLSGGQRQRVAIARALYQEPIALLADEPVASVDPARASDTVSLLTGIARENRLTLCMSLHNLELARRHFPRLVGLRHGRIVFDRPTERISDEEFRRLYELSQDEMLEDGVEG